MKKTLLLFVLLCNYVHQITAQSDRVLFSVNGTPVHVSEFKYIYTKTNGAKADFSEGSVREYLDLYTRFKMKVARARDMRLDTIPALMDELQGYRKQLAESYLSDREVSDKLIKEAYDRMQKDVDVSHILVAVAGNDTAAAMAKALAAQKRLASESFEAVAKAVSDDKNTSDNGGKIGYLTALLLPDGFYDFESAIYNTPKGGVSPIVRSPMGYHIIRVNDDRPARGEIEVAHILIRKQKDGVPQPQAKALIDSLRAVLNADSKAFDRLAQMYSQDGNSASKGGYLGFFGIGRYEMGFEDAAFSIAADGAFSPVYESSLGYHIIKRISKKGIESYDLMKTRLKARIQRDGRFELAKQAMIERIKKEAQLKEDKTAVQRFADLLDDTFLTYSWRQVAPSNVQTLFTLDSKPVLSTEFSNWLAANANRRLNYATQFNNDRSRVYAALYNDFVNEKALAHEETLLDVKYTDFKNLMREYEEGILLFEAIKQNVWDKASLDTVGLEKFFNQNRDKYMWDERAQLVTYALTDSAKVTVDAVRKYATKHDPQQVLKKFNKRGVAVTFKEETIEHGRTKVMDISLWKQGNIYQDKDVRGFVKTEKVFPKTQKTLKEARGYVVADYQEFLERQWVAELEKNYKVEVDAKVLQSIIKK